MRHHTSTHAARRFRPALLAVACTLALAACSDNDDGMPANDDMEGVGGVIPTGDESGTVDETPNGNRLAFVAGALAQTGQIERLAIDENFASTGTTPATTSDIRVATDGTDVYEIGRFDLDRLTRFRADDLETPVWQYSANGTETTVNPYEIVFASETKAYVVRYGSPFVWIVDPSATTEEAFKTGEIDLSAYVGTAADISPSPRPSDAVLVDDRLYVLMERLGGASGFDPDSNGYVAVIDTTTDTEIDTDPDTDGLPGVALASSNPGGLLYPEDSDVVYVVGRGNVFGEFNDLPGDPYDGGIETIDTESFERTLLLDDGTQDDDPDDGVDTNQGFFVDALVVSSAKGYVLTYEAFGVTTLRSFNPLTGTLDEGVVADLEDRDISTLALGPDGQVWVGLNAPDDAATGRGFLLLDPSDDSVVNPLVPTEFNPLDIVFVETPADSTDVE